MGEGVDWSDEFGKMFGRSPDDEPKANWTLAENLAYMERKLKEDGK